MAQNEQALRPGPRPLQVSRRPNRVRTTEKENEQSNDRDDCEDGPHGGIELLGSSPSHEFEDLIRRVHYERIRVIWIFVGRDSSRCRKEFHFHRADSPATQRGILFAYRGEQRFSIFLSKEEPYRTPTRESIV